MMGTIGLVRWGSLNLWTEEISLRHFLDLIDKEPPFSLECIVVVRSDVGHKELALDMLLPGLVAV